MGGCLANFLFSSVMSIEARASPILGKHYTTDPQPPVPSPGGQHLKGKLQTPSCPGPKELLVLKLTKQSTSALSHITMRKAGVSGALGGTWHLSLHPLHTQSPLTLTWMLVDLCPREHPGKSESPSQVLAAFFSWLLVSIQAAHNNFHT